MEKFSVSYENYGQMVNMLTIKTQEIRANAIYGLPRGGLPVAVHISHHLGIPMMLNLNQFIAEFPNGLLLVVDDIVDSGRTYNRFMEIAAMKEIQYKTAALFYKTGSVYKPDYYVTEIPSSLWVVFPWEDPREKCEINETFQNSCCTDGDGIYQACCSEETEPEPESDDEE